MSFEQPVGPESVPTNEELETIKSCAVLYRGEIFKGQIHSDARSEVRKAHLEAKTRDMVEGYVTSKGRFVDRVEAVEIADKADQIRESARKHKEVDKRLWSEDLKPEVIYPDRAK
jgi:hypothetical protein